MVELVDVWSLVEQRVQHGSGSQKMCGQKIKADSRFQVLQQGTRMPANVQFNIVSDCSFTLYIQVKSLHLIL